MSRGNGLRLIRLGVALGLLLGVLAAMAFDSRVAGPAMAATKPTAAAAAPATAAGAQKDPDDVDQFAEMVEELAGRAPGVFRSIPGLPAATAAAITGLDRSGDGGRSTGSFLSALAGWLIALVLIDLLIGFAIRGRCQRLIGQGPERAGLGATVKAALLEFLRPLAVLLVSRVALGAAFAGAGNQTLVAAAILDAVVTVVVFRFLLEVFLRPTWPAARLAPVEDGQASRLKRGILAVAVLARIGQVWGALLAGSAYLPAQLLVTAAIMPIAYGWIVWSKRDVFGTWIGRLFGSGSPAAVARGSHAWVLGMGLLVALVLLLRVYAALADRPDVPFGTMATLTTVILLLFGETLVRWVQGHPDAAAGRSDVEARLLRSGARLARVLMLIAAAGFLARVWVVESLSLVSADDWPSASRHWWLAAVTAFAGFITWEVINFVSQAYLAPATPDPAAATPATGAGSRAKTLAPLLRAALLTLTVAMFGLAVLSILGVNITPLVAGASILGLAISFGSQTLVKDIITGVFYLAEDAFRVGEYIDCGKAKGTVEGFALRSLRLRHQSGQLHTIPFGQLGQVTNFSRDWSTIKINLRFPRDVDLDKLRKAAKKIGQQLIDETDYAPDFIDPLKMQGVTEVLDDVLVIGFKFTVIPARPSEIQREAVRRLLTDLPKAGLRFAASTPTYIQVAVPAGQPPAPVPATASPGVVANTQVVTAPAG
ncbi:mechanosensitive ion channel family protein [Alsobacter sp. R-9]